MASMDSTPPTLRLYRRMGSMEQLFVCLNELKLNWGACISMFKIPGLSTISTPKLQTFCNKMYTKHESLQAQFLTIDTIYQFDYVYLGCLPFKIIRYNDNTHNEDFLHELSVKEMNHRFLFLNDFDLTKEKIVNQNYNINDILPLYRIVVYNEYIIINIHHAIADGLSFVELQKEFIRIINNDDKDKSMVKYEVLEDCIDPKYASSPTVNKMINYFVPTSFAMWFSKFYSNNSFLSRNNPLTMHNDDILRFKYMYCHQNKNNSMFSFPVKLPYNKFNWDLDYVLFKFDKKMSGNILKQCKLHKIHLSSLILYIVNASMIEYHNNILNKEYYQHVIGNMFSARPLFKDSKKFKFGMMAVPYNNIIEYHKNAKVNGDKFWKSIEKISELLWDKDEKQIIKVYKQKFPFLNTKKWIRYNWDTLIGKVPMGPPTVSNMQSINYNQDNYKYKCVEMCAAANPAVGFGAPYILVIDSIKGIDQMTFNFVYGQQFLSKNAAEEVVKKMKEKFKIIADSKTNYNSKL